MGTRFCIPLSEVSMDDVGRVGGKTASLGEMVRELGSKGVPVPQGFAVCADAYTALLDQGNARSRLESLLEGLDAADLADVGRRGQEARHLILGLGLPDEVAEAIDAAYAELSQGASASFSVAVRSSATAEDLPEASFAGQQATHLNVRGSAALRRACLDCFASIFTDRAIVYRVHHGFDHFVVRGAIAVQQMVRSDLGSAGVAFTIDPDTGFRDVVLIQGAWGLGESVVAGRVDPDEVLVFKTTLERANDPILRRRVGEKQSRMVYAHRGAATTRSVPVAHVDRERRCFTDVDAVRLARWAVVIEEHYSRRNGRPTPMDIEWAKDGRTGQLWIVQARPETVEARREPGKLTHFRIEPDSAPLVRGVAIGGAIGQGRVRIIDSVDDLPAFEEGEVLVADMTDPDWVPALRKAAAVVTNRGGRTCHAAIVSRELGVPCVVGTGDATESLTAGVEVTVSCATGNVGEVFEGRLPFTRQVVHLDDVPETRTKVMLILADPSQAFTHASLPVSGVGLVRQEFVAANHVAIHPLACLHPESLDDGTRERIQEVTSGYESPADFWVAKLAEGIGMIAAAFHPKPVIVRLSDFKSNEYRRLLGGEAFEPTEENPMIGWRGASRYVHPRFEDAFALECRALVHVRKAMGLDNVALMVPFCRTWGEGKAVLQAMATHGLRRGEDGLQIWMMCEVPSNVAAIDGFAEIFDGFSIGSNDLTQLVLGVDRDSGMLAHLFDEKDPAVLRTIADAIEGAHRYGRPIGLCGQAPSDDPEFARILVEQGIDSVALNPDAVLRAISVIARAERAVDEAANLLADG
jgi:pyruvate, water dikinase